MSYIIIYLVDESSFLLSIGSPQQKHDSGAVVVDPVDDSICQSLPSLKTNGKFPRTSDKGQWTHLWGPKYSRFYYFERTTSL